MKKIAVIGAGAAGMMAAYAAASLGGMVTLFEKNEKAGKKIYITGKGRCNLTNACDTEDFFRSVVRNPKFLYSAIYGFDSLMLRDMIESYGCPLKVERGERVFPVSDHASDVTGALLEALKDKGVDIHYRVAIKEIVRLEKGFLLKGTGQEKIANENTVYDSVIIACGGMSYPTTGSNGDGFRLLAPFSVSVEEPRPSLVPLLSPDPVCKALQGLSLKNVKAILKCGEKKVYEEQGEMLFTHEGVSGPLILSASCYYQNYMAMLSQKGKDIPTSVLTIDLKPALSLENLDKRVLRDFEDSQNKDFQNAITSLFPSKLIPVMVEKSGIASDKKVRDITREERLFFVNQIKNFEISISGAASFREAIVTQGGVKVSQVNPSTMELKEYPGIYVCGEMLDVDALTGGFNLQIAFSTGHLAGESAMQIYG